MTVLYFVTKIKKDLTPENIVLIAKCKNGVQRFLRERHKREQFYLFVAEEKDVQEFLDSVGEDK